LVFNITVSLAYKEDDEATLEANEALITEAERRSSVLSKRESELPMQELLKLYKQRWVIENSNFLACNS
jgi:IS4 transposase